MIYHFYIFVTIILIIVCIHSNVKILLKNIFIFLYVFYCFYVYFETALNFPHYEMS